MEHAQTADLSHPLNRTTLVFHRRDRRVLGWLVGGFVLILLFLVLDGLVGLRGAMSTRASLSSITEGQLLNVVLVGQVQELESTFGAIQYQLATHPGAAKRAEVISRVDRIQQSLGTLLLRIPLDDPDLSQWREVRSIALSITTQLKDMLALPAGAAPDWSSLIDARDRLSAAIGKLVESGFERAQATQRETDRATQRQSVEDVLLLSGCLIVACLFLRIATRIYYRMTEQAEELTRVSWQLLEKQESLARRLSHELHDELGQCLTALKTNFSRHNASGCVDPAWMQDCSQLLKESIRSAHEISQLLRPTMLDDFGLDSALGWLCERFEERNRIAVRYESGFHGRLEEQAETHIFRIAQEALTNVARHASASSVTMSLQKDENSVHLRIADNGVGIAPNPEAHTLAFGLTGMKARARSLSGTMKIRSAPGQGTVVEVTFPLRKAVHEETHPHFAG